MPNQNGQEKEAQRQDNAQEEGPQQEEQQKKEKSSRLRAVGLVSLATLLSRVLGLTRDMVFGALFRRDATDAYAIAFLIPNLLRRLLAEGILSTAFIPVFTSYLEKDKEEQKKAYSAILGIFVVVLIVVAVVGVFASPWLVKLFAPGFSGTRYNLAVYLTRLMFPFILLVGLASFWIGVLHTHRHFTMPALGPVMLNIGVISCALTLRHVFPESEAIAAMAVGVLVGGILQLLLQVIQLYRMGVSVGLKWMPSHPAIREILMLMGPTLLGLGVYQLNLLVSSAIASLLSKGAVTYIYYSNRLMELPLGVIAVAFATVNLPALAAKAEKEDWDGFRETTLFGIRGVLFVCIPAAFGLFMLREPIIGVLFQRGRFTYQDVLMCASIFAPAAFGLSLVGALRNVTPAFYAMKDTKTPVKIAIWAFVVNAALSAFFAFPLVWGTMRLGLGLDAFGLTLANTCSTCFSVVLSLYLLHRKIGGLDVSSVFRSAGRVLLASVVMAAVLWPLVGMGPWAKGSFLMRSLWLGGLVGVGGLVFLTLAIVLRVPELKPILQKLRRKL